MYKDIIVKFKCIKDYSPGVEDIFADKGSKLIKGCNYNVYFYSSPIDKYGNSYRHFDVQTLESRHLVFFLDYNELSIYLQAISKYRNDTIDNILNESSLHRR